MVWLCWPILVWKSPQGGLGAAEPLVLIALVRNTVNDDDDGDALLTGLFALTLQLKK
jgi:hypothetical protein